MNNYKDKQKKRIIWILITFIYFLTYVIINNSAESIVFLSVSLCLFLIYVIAYSGKIKIRITAYHIYLLLLCTFCYFSTLWALNKNLSRGKGNTLLEVFIIMSVVFLCADRIENPVDCLLKVVMWGGFLVTTYAIMYYGVNGILLVLRDNTRVDNSLMNANNLGTCAAYSVLIGIYYIMYDQVRVWNILLLPSVLILVASGSRKALFIVVLGVVLLVFLKSIDNKNILKGTVRVIFALCMVLVVFYGLSKLSIFGGLEARVQSMIAGLFGRVGADQSTLTRLKLVDMGMNIFREHPILGIGMDNSTVLISRYFYKDYYYLHNNFIELLADGGIVGFILYYSFYFVTIIRMIKYRNFEDKEYTICFSLLILILILDYGTVSYLIKSTYVFMMIFYFKTNNLMKLEYEKETRQKE